MSWLNRYKNVWRVALLMLLPAAILGPWGYSADGAPPAAWCHDPFILLENGRCVGLVSGATGFTLMANGFLSMSVGLVTGATIFPDRAGEFLGVCLVMTLLSPLVLPFFTTSTKTRIPIAQRAMPSSMAFLPGCIVLQPHLVAMSF